MGLLSSLLATYNIPFLLSLGAALIFAMLQIFSANGDSDADADGDANAHMGVDADVDADLDANLETDTAIDTASAATPDAPDMDSGHIAGDMLAALGIGRVPVTFILMSLLGSFGAVGLIGNALLVTTTGTYPESAIIPILIVSFVLALLITNRISSFLARLIPNTSTAIRIEQLVGRVGVVVSHSVSQTYGRVQVRDQFGSLHTVYAIIAEGEPVPDQREVALLAYDAARRCFIVKAMQ